MTFILETYVEWLKIVKPFHLEIVTFLRLYSYILHIFQAIVLTKLMQTTVNRTMFLPPGLLEQDFPPKGLTSMITRLEGMGSVLSQLDFYRKP